MYRNTRAIIDCNKLENNIKKIIKTYDGYKYYFGVVKNNAYGHGIECINYMLNSGINYLAVSSLEEALEIRKINKTVPVIVLEPINLDAAIEASKHNITITIDSLELFNSLLKSKTRIKFHLKIDSGMHRFGIVKKEDANYIYQHANKDLYMEGIYTHLSSGNPANSEYINAKKQFEKITEDIDFNKIDIVHLDRSLTLEQHEKIEYANGVRLGIIMYGYAAPGYNPSWKRKLINMLKGKKIVVSEPKLKLEPIFSFYSEVIEIKEIKAGEIVGYGGMHVAKEDERLAIVPYGFGDYLYNNQSDVCINGKLYPTIVINMDVSIIKVDKNVKIGDQVEIFGDQIKVRQKAHNINQNVYKLLASVSNRVPRVYKYNKETKEIKY